MLECMVLLPLNGNDVSMFYFKSILVFMYMFMGLVYRIDNGMVVSSSPIRGLGTLHCPTLYTLYENVYKTTLLCLKIRETFESVHDWKTFLPRKSRNPMKLSSQSG